MSFELGSCGVGRGCGRSPLFVSHLRQPCLVMCFDVDANVVDRKVLRPGTLEKVGNGENVIAGADVLVAVGWTDVSADTDDGAGGSYVLFGSPIRLSPMPANEQVLISAP